MRTPGQLQRLARDAKIRNLAALIVTLSSAVAFVFTRIDSHVGGSKRAFLLEWGPEMFFVPGVLIVGAYAIAAFRSPPVITIDRQRFLAIRAPGSHPVAIDQAGVSIESIEEMFPVYLTGQIRGPECIQLMEYFGLEFDRSGLATNVPVQLLVSELTRTDGGFWWTQAPGLFKSNGAYEVLGFLGSDGQYSAKDGDLFELRILIGTKRGGCLKNGLQMESLDQLPPHTFLSNPLVVRTKRP